MLCMSGRGSNITVQVVQARQVDGCILEQAVNAKEVAQQVFEVAPEAPAGKGPGPLPPQLQHLHM